MSGSWLRQSSNGITIVFVHGLFSANKTAWRSKEAFWPDLVEGEDALRDCGIYLFDYSTGPNSGYYSISDVSDALNAYFKVDGVWAQRFIVFVAHSMGGIVARHLAVSRQQLFVENDIKLGFFLVASPSLGSNYASLVSNLGLINNVQIDALKFSQSNIWLNDLDTRFRDLRESQRIQIVGKELMEANPIVLPAWIPWLARQIVTPESASRYFGEPLKMPDTDHITIAKPTGSGWLQHRLLVEFIRDHSISLRDAKPPTSTPLEKAFSGLIDINLPITGAVFVGRRNQLRQLSAGWEDGRTNVAVVVAMGGTGKTALIKAFLDNLRLNEWNGIDGVFCWSFDSQGNSDDRRHIAVNTFYERAFEFIGHTAEIPKAQNRKARLLARLFAEKRVLLTLDGLEPLQFSPHINNGELREKSLGTFLRALADKNRGMCLVTSRQAVYELRDINAGIVRLNLNQLDDADAVQLLRIRGVLGTEPDMLAAVKGFRNHALSINLLGTYLVDHYDGNVRRWKEVRPHEFFRQSDIGGRAEFVMRAYEHRFKGGGWNHLELAVLYIMGLFDRPAAVDAIESVLRDPPIKGISDRYHAMTQQEKAQNYRLALQRLRALDLINPADPLRQDELDTHPLVRAFFARRFSEEAPSSWRAAHERLYKYYEGIAVAKPKKAPDLEPLHYAISHACKAGAVEHAYNALLKRVRAAPDGKGGKLADSGALVSAYANFFEELWVRPNRLLDEKRQRGLLRAASFSLRASGHQRRALEPLEILLTELREDKKPDNAGAAIVARRAAQIRINLGSLADAERLGRIAVEYADKTNRFDLRSGTRATLGDVFHQRGQPEEAEKYFNVANQIFTEKKRTSRWLEAEAGYKYAEYLTTACKVDELAALAEQFRAQALRSKAPEIYKGYSHFVSALAAFSLVSPDLVKATSEVEAANDLFSAIGATEYTARTLAFGAKVLRLKGDHAGARRELDEAIYLSQTYEFKLVLADALLEQIELVLASNGVDTNDQIQDIFGAVVSIVDTTGYDKKSAHVAAIKSRIRPASRSRWFK